MRISIAVLAFILPFASAHAADSMSKDSMTKHHGTMSHATMSKHHDAMSHATMSKDAMMKHDSMTKTTDGK